MGLSLEFVEYVKKWMKSAFEMPDFGDAKSFLGVEFLMGKHGVTLRRAFFIRQILDSDGMLECKPANKPLAFSSKIVRGRPSEAQPGLKRCREAIGALQYISIHTLQDNAAAVGIISHHCASLSQGDWIAIKKVMRYENGTIGQSLLQYWNGGRTARCRQ